MFIILKFAVLLEYWADFGNKIDWKQEWLIWRLKLKARFNMKFEGPHAARVMTDVNAANGASKKSY